MALLTVIAAFLAGRGTLESAGGPAHSKTLPRTLPLPPEMTRSVLECSRPLELSQAERHTSLKSFRRPFDTPEVGSLSQAGCVRRKNHRPRGGFPSPNYPADWDVESSITVQEGGSFGVVDLRSSDRFSRQTHPPYVLWRLQSFSGLSLQA